MYEFAPVLGSALDRGIRPVLRFLHVTLGLSPSQVTWASFWVSAAAAVAFATGRVVPGLVIMAAGQVLDGLDGGIARQYGLVSAAGHRLDTWLDRASEIAIFLGCAVGGLVSLKARAARLRRRAAPHDRCRSFAARPRRQTLRALFRLWVPYPLIFSVIFIVNLAAYVVGLLVIDCRFQRDMDALGGDLNTVASRAARAARAARAGGGARASRLETT